MVTTDYLLKFINEDAPSGDITSESVVPDIMCRAVITAEQAGIIAGIAESGALFRNFGVTVREVVPDGTGVMPGDAVMELDGRARKILLVERTALNIIGRMSGIATMTCQYVQCVQSIQPSCRVAATRKTCPGLRELDKKAVVLGGGDPHRRSLSDGILIKDNHLALVSLEDAIAKAKAGSDGKAIEVEVSSTGDAVRAARAGADRVMLDNMSPDAVQDTLNALRQEGLREFVRIELSGGMDLGNVGVYAALGPDMISIGALTHSVKNFSVHLDILRPD